MKRAVVVEVDDVDVEVVEVDVLVVLIVVVDVEVVDGDRVLVVVGARVELVLDEVVTVVDGRMLLEVDVVCPGTVEVVRVVLVLVLVLVRSRGGLLVEVVLVATGGAWQADGAGELRAAKRRGWSRFTAASAKSMQ